MQRLSPRTSQRVRISPQLIMQYELLRLPRQELTDFLREMSYENPLLEVVERHPCPRCGHDLPRSSLECTLCAAQRKVTPPESALAVAEPEAGGDWLESVGARELLSETLWRQVLESDLAGEQRQIAFHLLADLDERGYLATPPTEHAAMLDKAIEQVEEVRQRLLRFEPLGIAALSTQECLRVQAEALVADQAWARLALRLLQEQWDTLMTGELEKVARALACPIKEIKEAVIAIREQFHLYPAGSHLGHGTEPVYLEPDVRFRLSGQGAAATMEVEVLEAQRYAIHVAPEYRLLLQQRRSYDEGTRQQLVSWGAQVHRVATALRQRWDTLGRVCLMIADFQRDFFLQESRASVLRPLTREEVANAIGVHPSTVGRAVHGKYVELPNRRIVPLSFFFDSSAPIHALITQLIARETTLLSDDTLCDHLQRAGWSMTRRAVSQHRESMGILPTHLRRRQRRLSDSLAPRSPR